MLGGIDIGEEEQTIMTKGNVVCFDCRITLRRDTWRYVAIYRPESIGAVGKTLCPNCRNPCYFIGPSIPIPKKSDVRGWNRLQKEMARHQTLVSAAIERTTVRAKHDLEKRIRSLEIKDANPGRSSLIKRLKEQLAAL